MSSVLLAMGTVTPEALDAWYDDLAAADAAGTFFMATTLFIASAIKGVWPLDEIRRSQRC